MVAVLDAFTSSGGGGGGGSMPDITVKERGAAAAVAMDAETTVVTRVTPGGFTFRLSLIVATGNVDAEWVLYDDATEVYRGRTSPSQRTLKMPHGNPIPFAAGHACTLKVIHEDAAPRNFFATLLGYDA